MRLLCGMLSGVIQRLLTREEVAKMLQVSVKTVRRLPIAQHRLGARTVRYLPEDVMDYLQRVKHDAA